MDPEQLFIGRALDRIKFLIVFLSGAGALVTAVYGGWRWALGYVLGAAAGYLNFRWLKKLVDSLGEAAGGKPPRARMAVFLGLRYLLLGARGSPWTVQASCSICSRSSIHSCAARRTTTSGTTARAFYPSSARSSFLFYSAI